MFNITLQAIHGYRETEKPVWNDVNNAVLSRLKAIAFPTTPASNVMQHVHGLFIIVSKSIN